MERWTASSIMGVSNQETTGEKMAKDKMTNTPKGQDEMQAAAELVLQQERQRKRRAAKRARRLHRKQQQEQLAAVQRMHHSVEVIKRCMIGITAVMVVSLVILLLTINKVKNDVAVIERQVDHVRESLRNPMESLGRTFGKQLDEKLNTALGLQPEQERD